MRDTTKAFAGAATAMVGGMAASGMLPGKAGVTRAMGLAVREAGLGRVAARAAGAAAPVGVVTATGTQDAMLVALAMTVAVAATFVAVVIGALGADVVLGLAAGRRRR